MFCPNVGGIDRVLRVTLGMALTIAGLLLMAGRSRLGTTVVVVGLVVLISGVIRFCGLYIPFGISTACPRGHDGPVQQMCCDVSMAEMRGKCGASKPAVSQEKEASRVAMNTSQGR